MGNDVGAQWSLVERLRRPKVVLVSVALQRVPQHVKLIGGDVDGPVENDPLNGLVTGRLRQRALKQTLTTPGNVFKRVGDVLQRWIGLIGALGQYYEDGDGGDAVWFLLCLRPVGVQLRVVGVQLKLSGKLHLIDGVLRAATVLPAKVQTEVGEGVGVAEGAVSHCHRFVGVNGQGNATTRVYQLTLHEIAADAHRLQLQTFRR
ncbi:hypothetical protein TYRP_017738 [Tyrophagus putrescentiae]|nr:hypothetical protein TYRP_017738 [Tyrophagus putrescentiae]